MAISDFSSSTPDKQWIKVLTVDPRTRVVQGEQSNRYPVSVSIYEVPVAFRWPAEGEWWSVYREGDQWYLGSPLQSDDPEVAIEILDPGDTLIGNPDAKIVAQGELQDHKGDKYVRKSEAHVPLEIEAGETFEVYENRQVLYAIPLIVTGDIVNNGHLVQVT